MSSKKSFFIQVIVFSFLLIFNFLLIAQEKSDNEKDEELLLSLEELLSIKVSVGSFFVEEDLIVPSTVSSIKPEEWKKLGARRTHEAFNGEMGMVNFPTIGGSNIISIRGYTNDASVRGVTWMLDGIPLNTMSFGTSAQTVSNWELGTLNKIEIIKGPGSALYGSDAFHGVVALKTFESEKDYISIEGAGALNLYGDASIKVSQGIGNKIRLDLAAGLSLQGDQNIGYVYEDLDPAFPFIPTDIGTGTRKYKYESLSGMLKLRINPGKKIKIKLGGYLSNWKTEGFPGIRTVVFHLRENEVNNNEAQFIMGNGSFKYQLPKNISVEINSYYWQTVRSWGASQSESILKLIQKIPALSNLWAKKINLWVDDIRTGISFTIKQPDNYLNLQWVAGYSYTYMSVEKAENKLFYDPPGEWRDTPFELTPGKLEMEGLSRNINSGFVQLKWGAVENKLYLIAGGRLDKYSDFGTQFTPRGGLIFLPTQDSSIKILYGCAFRAGVGYDLTSIGLATKGNPEIKPETIETYELIYMNKGENWRYSINSFFSYWKDGIVQSENPDFNPDAPIGTPDFYANIMVNKGRNSAYGGEVTAFYEKKPFAFDFGFAYVKSKAYDVQDPIDKAIYTDQDYDMYPEYQIRLGVNYLMKSAGINFYLNNHLLFGMKEYNALRTSINRPERESLPPYWKMDLSISKEITKKASIMLILQNLNFRKNSLPSVWGMKGGYEDPGFSILIRGNYEF